jgi:hypothetical protein
MPSLLSAKKRRRSARHPKKLRRNGQMVRAKEAERDAQPRKLIKTKQQSDEKPELRINTQRATRVGRRRRRFAPAVDEIENTEQGAVRSPLPVHASAEGAAVGTSRAPQVHRAAEDGTSKQHEKMFHGASTNAIPGGNTTQSRGLSRQRPASPRHMISPITPAIAEFDVENDRTCSSLKPELLASLDPEVTPLHRELNSLLGSTKIGGVATNSLLDKETASLGGSTRGTSLLHQSEVCGITEGTGQTRSTRSSALSSRTGTTGRSSALTLSEQPGLSTLISLDNPDSTQMTDSVVTTLSSLRTWDISKLSSRGTAMGGPPGGSIGRPSSMVATTTDSRDDIDLAEDMRLMNRY